MFAGRLQVMGGPLELLQPALEGLDGLERGLLGRGSDGPSGTPAAKQERPLAEGPLLREGGTPVAQRSASPPWTTARKSSPTGELGSASGSGAAPMPADVGSSRATSAA